MTLPEVLLWQRLRKRAGKVKFRRQHSVGGHVLDFYCAEAKLDVEIDGEGHSRGDRAAKDADRDRALTALGLNILRLPAADVLHDVDLVADTICRAALPLHRSASGPPPHVLHGEDQE